MRKRITLLVAALMLALTMAFAAFAQAAPIVCQGNQTATKTPSGWQCINNGDNPTGSGRHQGNGDKFGKTFP
jgi:hypothetical protein